MQSAEVIKWLQEQQQQQRSKKQSRFQCKRSANDCHDSNIVIKRKWTNIGGGTTPLDSVDGQAESLSSTTTSTSLLSSLGGPECSEPDVSTSLQMIETSTSMNMIDVGASFEMVQASTSSEILQTASSCEMTLADTGSEMMLSDDAHHLGLYSGEDGNQHGRIWSNKDSAFSSFMAKSGQKHLK